MGLTNQGFSVRTLRRREDYECLGRGWLGLGQMLRFPEPQRVNGPLVNWGWQDWVWAGSHLRWFRTSMWGPVRIGSPASPGVIAPATRAPTCLLLGKILQPALPHLALATLLRSPQL